MPTVYRQFHGTLNLLLGELLSAVAEDTKKAQRAWHIFVWWDGACIQQPQVLVRVLDQGQTVLPAARVVMRGEEARVLDHDITAEELDAHVFFSAPQEGRGLGATNAIWEVAIEWRANDAEKRLWMVQGGCQGELIWFSGSDAA
jgi:hypothetical protein